MPSLYVLLSASDPSEQIPFQLFKTAANRFGEQNYKKVKNTYLLDYSAALMSTGANFFPWNGAHLGASFKGATLESLADCAVMDACYGAAHHSTLNPKP